MGDRLCVYSPLSTHAEILAHFNLLVCLLQTASDMWMCRELSSEQCPSNEQALTAGSNQSGGGLQLGTRALSRICISCICIACICTLICYFVFVFGGGLQLGTRALSNVKLVFVFVFVFLP